MRGNRSLVRGHGAVIFVVVLYFLCRIDHDKVVKGSRMLILLRGCLIFSAGVAAKKMLFK